MAGISSDGDTGAGGERTGEAEGSMAYRARSVLSIRPFRRLWGVTYLCSMSDWLSLLALSGLANKLTEDYKTQSFAFAGVVLTQLLPGLLFAPLGGLFADRFDRRKVMALADIGRFGLLLSIAVVGSPWWLFAGNFLVGCCSLLWIPSKDAAVPNLLRRPDQVETANQLGLVMTYGISVISGAGLYALITGVSNNLNLSFDDTGLGIVKVILILNAAFYLTSSLLIWTRIPELSRRAAAPAAAAEVPAVATGATTPTPRTGFLAMVRDAGRFVRSTPLVRGLLIGMLGAMASAGALVGSAQAYALSLRGGDSTFGLLFVALFVGLVSGMTGSPKLVRRLPRNRLFGIAIVVAGLSQLMLALSPHPIVSLPFVLLLGACAGAAFLTGVTIIGTEVDDSVRGRINAIYQSMMKIVLAGAMALTPLLVGLVRPHHITLFGRDMLVDGTRPVLLGAGVLAALVGVVAYRQMDDRRSESILSDLVSAVRGKPRRSSGLLIAIEGNAHLDTSVQAKRLAEWLGSADREVLLATDPVLDDAKLRAVLSGAQLSSARAHALVAAAVRADLVEREIRPALDRGALVVMERFVDSPLAHLSAAADLDPAEVEGLADWATARLRPSLTILLDRDPAKLPPRFGNADHHWHVQGVLADMAAADPDRYVVVDGDGTPEEVAARVSAAVYVALTTRGVTGLDRETPRTPVEAG